MAQTSQITFEEELAQAKEHHAGGKLNEAEQIFRTILDKQPDHYPTVHYLGVLLYQKGALPEALEWLEKAVTIDNTDAHAWNNYGIVLASSGEKEKALECWQNSINQDDSYAEPHNNIAYALWEMRDYEQAEQHCRKALEINPDYVQGLNNLGNALASQKKFEEALECWKKLLEKMPQNANAWNNLGNALREMGDLKQSEEKCRKALEYDPQNANAWNNLGNALRDQEKHEEAQTCYEKAAALNPRIGKSYYELAISMISRGRQQEGLQAASKAITIEPEFSGAYSIRSMALRELGRLEEAEQDARKAITLEPENAEYYIDLADTLLLNHEVEKARICLAQAENIGLESARGYVKKGLLLEKMDRYDDAVKAIDESLKLAPNLPNSWHLKAHILLGGNRLEEGLEAVKEVTKINPDYKTIYSTHAEILMGLGHKEEALDIIRQGQKAGDDNPMLYFSLSKLKKYESPDDPDFQTLLSLRETKANLGPQQRASLNMALFKAYQDMKDDEKAFEHLQIANQIRAECTPYPHEKTEQLVTLLKKEYVPDFVEKFKNCGYPSQLPVFIVGTPRSGTTLTEQILSAHPDVHGGGELFELGTISEEAERMNPANAAQIGRRYVEAIQKHDPTGQAKRITDKMPTNLFRIGIMVCALPGAKIIHCRRNPMDTALSCYKQLFAHGHYWSYSFEGILQFYKSYKEAMDLWSNLFPDSFLEIDYEETVTNFEEQARKLIDYIGLEWHEACMEPHKQKRSVITASKNQVTKPIYTSSIESWKRYEKQMQPLYEAFKKEGVL